MGERQVGRQEEADQLAMLKSILNEMEALITVCTPEDGKLLFLNDSIRKHFGIVSDGVGEVCYKLLQGLDQPCEHCPYLELIQEPDKTIVWNHKDVNGSIFHKTATLVDWPGGQKAHLEYAIDITELIKTQEMLENRDKRLGILNSAAIILLSQSAENFELTMSAGVSLIAGIADVDRMSVSRNMEKPDGLYASQIYRWSKVAGTSISPLQELQVNSYERHIPRWRDILKSGQCINGPVSLMPEAATLKSFGCMSVLAIPVFNKGMFWGFVLYENLTEERTYTEGEVNILRTASFMLVNTVIRNEEAQKIREADRQMMQMMQETEYQNRLLRAVNHVSTVLLQSDTDSFKKDIRHAMGIMAESAGIDRVYFWENYVRESRIYCRQIFEWSENTEPRQDIEKEQGFLYSDILPSWEIEFLQGHCINGMVRDMPEGVRSYLSKQGIVSILVVPIYLQEQMKGFVAFDDCHKERVFSDNEVSILRSASELMASALMRNRLEKNVHKLEVEVDKIFYDPLTDIYNRRFFDETMQRLIRSLSRSGGIISLMMIDIDYFKNYNDAYGHIEGDNCLKMIAKALQDSAVRADDFIARYGGEEFVVVLPNTDAAGARIMADKIMENVHNCRIPHEKSKVADYVTISIGVMTGKVEHTHSSDTYIQRADEMLYESKQGGRNRCSFTVL